MISKTAIIELTYGNLCNQINTFQHERQLSNEDMETIVSRILSDIRSVRLIESADTILKLTQQVETLEKKEAQNDKSNTDA